MGKVVGMIVVGSCEGATLGVTVVGSTVEGLSDRARVGCEDVGEQVGAIEGPSVDGLVLGVWDVGLRVGSMDGSIVGPLLG